MQPIQSPYAGVQYPHQFASNYMMSPGVTLTSNPMNIPMSSINIPLSALTQIGGKPVVTITPSIVNMNMGTMGGMMGAPVQTMGGMMGSGIPLLNDKLDMNSRKREMGPVYKLFVGQLPKNYGNEELSQLFSEFGAIKETYIQYDKMTKEPKGCAFVTFTSQEAGEKAIAALHGVRTLPGMKCAVQVKWADTSGLVQGQNSRVHGSVKLFVAAIPESYNEDQLSSLFGMQTDPSHILSTHILRKDGVSRGAGFVTVANKDVAEKLINDLNEKHIVPGASRLLQVRVADGEQLSTGTTRLFVGQTGECSKDQIAHLFSEFGQVVAVDLINKNGVPQGCCFVTMMDQNSAHAAIAALNGIRKLDDNRMPLVVRFAESRDKKDVKASVSTNEQITKITELINLKEFAQKALQKHVAQTQQTGESINGSQTVLLWQHIAKTADEASRQAQEMYPEAYDLALDQVANSTQPFNPPPQFLSLSLPDSLPQTSHVPSYASLGAGLPTASAAPSLSVAHSIQQQHVHSMPPKDMHGDHGGSSDDYVLSITGLPKEWTDSDLMKVFDPFGSVTGAKVLIDSSTGRSRGIGFLTMSSLNSATAAVNSMNDLVIGDFKLGVSLKNKF